MSLLAETLARITPPDEAAIRRIEATLAAAMPGGTGLGALRELLLKYAAIYGTEQPELPKKATIICCADHGVAAMKVSAYPQSTTLMMTENYLVSKGGTANALSNFAGAELLVADIGINADTNYIPGLLQHQIARGTANCAVGPAMTREQAIQALETGITFANELAAKGCRCFLPGEMGIANTTSSACVVAACCGLTPEQATGRGTNISDERMKVKIEVVRQALEINQPDPEDGLDVLSKVSGFEIGCIAGIMLGAAANHGFVVLDGFNTGAAALIANALCPLIPHYLMGSHIAAEPAHIAILKKLNIKPYMDMHFRLGEACGSSIAVNLLDASVRAFTALTRPVTVDFTTLTMPPAKKEDELGASPFYCSSFPQPDKKAMEACQLRIDNLAKPIYCLGRLEEIAVNLAGILGQERPALNLPRALLIFSKGELTSQQTRLTAAFAAHAGAEVTVARLEAGRDPMEAFDFGREAAAKITAENKLLGLALAETDPSAPVGHKAALLREALLNEDGSLRYNAADFLFNIPAEVNAEVSALMAAIFAAANNGALVVLDDEATEIVARYTELLCPTVRPYLLHTQPGLLDLDISTGGGCIAALGLKIADASLHMVNDMKTFAEAKVPVANDGPGAGRQVE